MAKEKAPKAPKAGLVTLAGTLDYMESAQTIANYLKSIGVSTGTEIRGPKNWLWILDSGKMQAWSKNTMPISLPLFRVYFRFSFPQKLWFAPDQSGVSILQQAGHWGCPTDGKIITNGCSSEKIWAQALLRASGQKNHWPFENGKSPVAEPTLADPEPMDNKAMIAHLNAMGFKVVKA